MPKVKVTVQYAAIKQIAQRATIAHLSTMCHSQMSWFSNLFEPDETERPW